MSELSVRGWMSEDEMLALRRWGFGKNCLEMGAYEGLSTCNLASTAKSLMTVDTFDGRGTNDPKETEAILKKNLESIDRACDVQIVKGEFATVLPLLPGQFDFIFIDGSHDYDSVKQDIELADAKLRPGGVIAFHDYDDEHPGVVRAVDEYIKAGSVTVGQADSLVAVKKNGVRPAMKEPKFYCVMPHRDGWSHYGAVTKLSRFASKRHSCMIDDYGTSVLTLVFNTLLSNALNARDRDGCTHMAMLHNDVVPGDYFVDTLYDEMCRCDLDFISAVVPLKNERGLTSTATDTPGNPWGNRRLTMTEVMQLPETFKAKDVPYRQSGACLLLNSGCWLMKLDEPWVQGLHFRQQDRIAWSMVDQKWVAQSISEDWDFSRQLAARGCRLGATRKVEVYHQLQQYHNRSAWGTWTEDQDWLTAEREIAEYKAKQEAA